MELKRKSILFFISLDHRCFSTQLDGIFQYPRARDWRVQVVSDALSAAKMRKTVEYWKPSGIIVEYSNAFRIAPDLFGDVPTVFIDIGRREPPKQAHVVGFDSSAAGKMGAEYLLGLNLSAYAYVGYRQPVAWDLYRRRAFMETVRKANQPVTAFFTKKAIHPAERFKRLHDWIKALPRPCGVMACNDRMGEEVLNICARLGIRVPEEIAVLGVDNDTSLCENINPSLASIDPDFCQSGFFAAQILDELMSSPHRCAGPFIQRFHPPRGVEVRQSVRRLKGDRFKIGLALEMIRRRACDGLDVGDVVSEMGMSRRAAEKHFRNVTGKSILEEIRDVRFAKVFKLLRDPRRQIGVIAGLCGFDTEVALRKAFRMRTGMSMSDWRSREIGV